MFHQNIVLHLDKDFDKSLKWYPNPQEVFYKYIYEVKENVVISNIEKFDKILILTNQNNPVENGIWCHLILNCDCLGEDKSFDHVKHEKKLFRCLDMKNYVGYIFEVHTEDDDSIFVPIHISINDDLAKHAVIEAIKTDSQYSLTLIHKDLSTIWGKDPVKFVILKGWNKKDCQDLQKSEIIRNLYTPGAAGYKKSEQSFISNSLSLDNL